MPNKSGFTILELIITIGMTAFLVVSITLVYQNCFRVFNAGEDRSKVRTELSQAMDLMTRELTSAQSISQCNENSLTYTTVLGDGTTKTFTNYLYNASDAGDAFGYTLPHTYSQTSYDLLRLEGSYTDVFGHGAVKASHVTPPGTAVFSCVNGLVTIDLTSNDNGEHVHLRTQVRPRNMPAGLVGWWKLDDGTAGATPITAVDSSGNGNTGALTNGPTWTSSGKITNAAVFDGSNDYIDTGRWSNSLTAITVCSWVKPTSGTRQDIAARWVSGGGGYQYSLLQGVAPGKFEFYVSTSGSNPPSSGISSTTIVGGTWYHVCGTYDNSYIRLYVNGNMENSFAQSGDLYSSASNNNLIGKSGDAFFSGTIDDVRIYNRALTGGEIAEIYQAGMGS